MIRILLLSLVILANYSYAEETVVIKEAVSPGPDPLDLKKDWWEFFDVPFVQLSERTALFNEKLTLIKASLKTQEHQDTLQLLERLSLELNVFLKKKNDTPIAQPSPVQFLGSYSIKQLLEVQSRLLKQQSIISNLKDKIEGHRTSSALLQKKLDQLIVSYPALPGSSIEKLHGGLEIIEKRFELALQQIGLSQAQAKMEGLQKERENLQEELKLAQQRLSFEDQNQAELIKTQKMLEKEIELSSLKEHQLEKMAFYQDQTDPENELYCCLWDFKLLSQSVKTELLEVQALLGQIKLFLYDSTPQTQDLLQQWKKRIVNAQARLKKWNARIDEDRVKIGHLSTKQPANEKIISDIHQELDAALSKLEELKFQIKHSELLNSIIESRLIKEAPLGDIWRLQLNLSWTSFLEWIETITGYVLIRIHDQPITLAIALKALSIILATFLISRYVRKILTNKRFFTRMCTDSTEYIILRCLHYSIIVIGFMLALAYIGLDFTNLAIVAGALGIGIGFGLQSMVNNIVSGFSLLVQRHIKVGDLVELGGQLTGKVQAINLQNTHIRSMEGADIIVPNAQLSGERLMNWTMKDPYRRYRAPFSIAYGTDKDLVRKVVVNAVKAIPATVKNNPLYPDPQVWMTEYGENAMHFELVAWFDTTISTRGESRKSVLLWTIDNALAANGIKIPYPVYAYWYPEPAKE